MRVHHLNCVTMCPPGGRMMDGRTGARGPALLCCHCLLLELHDRLVLIDTGFGVEDVRFPRPRLSPLFLHFLCRPQLLESNTAIRQIERLGFNPRDVTDIVLTHLDFDHAGGLDDFPQARVHLLEAERVTAAQRTGPIEKGRFRPQQWARTLDKWVSYEPTGTRWFDFEAVRDLEGLPPEILIIPLRGHTLGHAGIAIDVGGEWMLHAGDAYFFREEMSTLAPRCTLGLRAYQWLMEEDRRARLNNQERLRGLIRDHGEDVRVFCAHDIVELELLIAAELAGSRHQEGSAKVRRLVRAVENPRSPPSKTF